MADITHATSTIANFRTAAGETLPEATLSYVSRGSLAENGRNAILITYDYTSGPRMIEPEVASSEGGLDDFGQPGRTDRHGPVFCHLFEHVGSSYGSTNAASVDPRTGQPYGSRFPRITVEDTVNAQKHMLDGLGVKHLRAVVGPSYGGFQASQWGVTFPDFLDGIVPVVTSPKTVGVDRIGGFVEMVWSRSELEWWRLLRCRRRERYPGSDAGRYTGALWDGEFFRRAFPQ